MSRDAFFKHVKRHDVYSYIVEEARKKKLPFTLGKVLYSVYRKSPHHGRYPWCGSSSVENIDDFFFHDCKLN